MLMCQVLAGEITKESAFANLICNSFMEEIR
jgi:hypothetical protein